MKQTSNKETLRKVLKLIQPYWFFLTLSILFAFASVVLTLYLPILTGKAVDCIIGKGAVDFTTLLPILTRMGIIALSTGLIQWLMNICNNKMTYSVIQDMRQRTFTHLQVLPFSYIDKKPVGDMVSRIVSDVDQFADGLLMGFNQFFTGVLTILITLGFMVMLDIRIALIVFILTPSSLLVAKFVAQKTHVMFEKQSTARADETAIIDETIGNLKVVKSFHREEEMQRRFDKVNEKLGQYSLQAIFYSSTTNPATRFLNNCIYAIVGVVGGLLCIKGDFTVGLLTVMLSYATQYTKPFNEISGVITELQNAFVCANRVFALLEEEPEKASPAETIPHFDGTVQLQDVSFSYTPEQNLIEHLHVKVDAGQKIAIVGPTGCGKTTLINLLMRFYDVDEGSIYVSGKETRSVSRESLRSGFGMVLQDTWLKRGSIHDNIAFGKPDATREEVIKAAKASHAHGFIKRLPQGYDTMITEDGGNLSQGQKQLLCIARVMLALPPMLILDEATSSIDTRTEIRIQKAFHKLMDGRTSFIVAHRLSTIQEADLILVMKDGNVIEQGTHKELLAQNGFYTKLYMSQFPENMKKA
ncbi:MAG: ABC transporter ATP-binding protein [Lachnospiraceae bacterium]|nr:ABC transporter ATP-binding protein [Lachnospiraceae bacterium]